MDSGKAKTRFLAPLRNDSGGSIPTFTLSGTTNTAASPCPRCHRGLPPLSSRPAPAVIATCPRCHRGLPPPSSRPSPCCHLDRRERSQTGLGMDSGKAKTRFLASLRNDSGGSIPTFTLSGTTSTAASPCPRCHRGLPPLSSRPAPAVIAAYLRCHLGLPPLSSRPKGEISNRAWNGLRQSKNKISRSASK